MKPLLNNSRRATQIWAGLVVATLLATLLPANSFAYTQQENGGSGPCGEVKAEPCLEWFQNETVYYWMGAALAQEEVNLAHYTKGAIEQNWNAVTDALQPNFRQTTDLSVARRSIRTGDDWGFVFGWEVPGFNPNNVWRPCSTCTWRIHYETSAVYYNHRVIWNVDNIFQKISDELYKLDARCVILHENGHAEGLGHSGSLTAVMEPNCYISRQVSLQQDDRDGLRAIYRSGL